MDPRCKKCNARCCRYYCFQIDSPDTFEEFDNIRWYLMHDNTTVHIDLAGDWYIKVDNRCKNLVEPPGGGHACKDYANRAFVCRQLSPARCDFARGHYSYEELFTTPQELEVYARRMLGDLAWKAGQKKLARKK